ncbi:MAG: T9SS type A sorting domain-containing protein [Chitinophagales bacterium]
MKKTDLFPAGFICLLWMFPLFTFAQASFTETEPNDSFLTANSLAMGDTMNGEICTYPEVDFFSITIPEDGILRIYTSMSTTNPDAPAISISVWSETELMMTEFFPNVAFGSNALDTLSVGCIAGANYYIKFYSPYVAYCYDYSFSFGEDVPAYANDAEPNNSFLEALPLAYDTYAEGHINYYSAPFMPLQEDYYRIITPTAGLIHIYTDIDNIANASNSLTVSVFGPLGGNFGDQYANIGTFQLPTSDTLSWGCMAADTFYIKLFHNNIYDCGTSYRIRYTVDAPAYPNDIEPNDNIAQATFLPYDTPTYGELYFRSEPPVYANDDYYMITTPEAGILHLYTSVDNMSTNTNQLNIALISATGNTFGDQYAALGTFQLPVSDTLSWACLDADTFYIKCFQTGVYDCGTSYALQYIVEPPAFGSDTEPNNSFADAEDIPYDTPFEGQLDFKSEPGVSLTPDFFRLITPEDGTLTIYIDADNFSTGSGNFHLNLYSASQAYMGEYLVPVGTWNNPVSDTLRWGCIAADTFYIQLFENTIFDCGTSYRIQYFMEPAAYGTDAEPNDTPDEAVPLALDSWNGGTLAYISEPGIIPYGVDNFSWTIGDMEAVDITLSVEWEGDFAEGNVQWTISDPDMGIMHNTTVGIGAKGLPNTETVHYDCLPAGTYYINVLNADNGHCGIDYGIYIETTEPVYTNDPEPDNTFAEAYFLPGNTEQEGHLFFNEDTEDYYKVSVDASGSLTIYTSGAVADGSANLLISVYDLATALQGSGTADMGTGGIPVDDSVSFSLTPDNFYYVVISIQPLSSCASYKISYPTATVSVQDNWLSDVHVYPIPAEDILHIDMPDIPFTGNIITLSGANCLSFTDKHDIDISLLPEGLYTLRIQTEYGYFSRNFVKN